jgi:hypothetical protein
MTVTPQELARDDFGTILRKLNVPGGPNSFSLGDVIIIDDVNGNDTTGVINGLPFKTVEAAIAYINTYSFTEVTMWLLPGRYTIAAGFTMPATCSMRGFSLQVCSITLTTAVSTTMITMGENSRIEDLTLTLTSASDTANLVLVELPGTTSITSKIRTCVLNIDNAVVSTNSTTDVYGLYVTGTGILGPATFSFNQTRSTTMNLRSNGNGHKYGIYLPSAGTGCQISLRDSNVYVAAPRDLTSAGTYTGVCCDNTNSQIQLRTCSVSGVPYQSPTTNPKVRLFSLTNVALSGLQTLQGVTLIAGDRILLGGQNTASQNVVWVVASGAWTHPADMPIGSNASGAWIEVNEGTFASQKWLCVSYPAVVGTNALTWRHSYSGVDLKLPVLARYTGGAPTGARAAQDSYTPANEDRLFLDQATSAVDNGIWVYNSTGAWTRAGDMPVGSTALNSYVTVELGDDVGHAFICTTVGTVGTDALTFVPKYNGSDILQLKPLSGNVPNGINIGPGVDLVTKSTSGRPFSTYTRPTTLVYGYRGNVPNGIRYLWQGLQTALDSTQVFYRFQQDTIVQGISIVARNTDLGATVVKATVLKSLSGIAGQGIATPVWVSITNGVTMAENYTASMMFERGSFLAVQLEASSAVNPGDFTVEIDAY